MQPTLKTQINQAVSLLQAGELVAFPTETVYGLGADAKNPDALRKIFSTKQRPTDHPVIVHIAAISELNEWAINIPTFALQLADAFWPGPLTLILPKAPDVLDLVTGKQATVGIRMPDHPLALKLLKQFGSGLAAPSANRFGRISPTTAQAVREELGDAVQLILDGGACAVGVESTIVDCSDSVPVILRPGMISQEDIAKVLSVSVVAHKKNAPRVSGSFKSHYAPATPTQVLSTQEWLFFLENVREVDLPIALVTRDPNSLIANQVERVVMPNDALSYAKILYSTLRSLDKKQFKKIVVEQVPSDMHWRAVYDRLQRASY